MEEVLFSASFFVLPQSCYLVRMDSSLLYTEKTLRMDKNREINEKKPQSEDCSFKISLLRSYNSECS